jgi:hypothetical protein
MEPPRDRPHLVQDYGDRKTGPNLEEGAIEHSAGEVAQETRHVCAAEIDPNAVGVLSVERQELASPSTEQVRF